MANRPKAKRDPALSADIRRMLKAGIPYQAALARALEAKTKRHRGEPIQSPVSPTSDAFLQSYEWRRVRMEALKRYGPRCQCCGATPKTAQIHVDHIKPRKLFPNLALSLDNLQILCHECNHGKGNWDMTDWREQTLTKAE